MTNTEYKLDIDFRSEEGKRYLEALSKSEKEECLKVKNLRAREKATGLYKQRQSDEMNQLEDYLKQQKIQKECLEREQQEILEEIATLQKKILEKEKQELLEEINFYRQRLTI